jgi:hypothetical protein
MKSYILTYFLLSTYFSNVICSNSTTYEKDITSSRYNSIINHSTIITAISTSVIALCFVFVISLIIYYLYSNRDIKIKNVQADLNIHHGVA